MATKWAWVITITLATETVSERQCSGVRIEMPAFQRQIHKSYIYL